MFEELKYVWNPPPVRNPLPLAQKSQQPKQFQYVYVLSWANHDSITDSVVCNDVLSTMYILLCTPDSEAGLCY